MRFEGAGNFLAAESDVDPAAAPQSVLITHALIPKSHSTRNPRVLHLALLGTESETLTVSLYYLIEDRDVWFTVDDYRISGVRWIPFATGQVVTNGVLYQLTTDIPAGGIIYARRTADTITGGQTRRLYFAWAE